MTLHFNRRQAIAGAASVCMAWPSPRQALAQTYPSQPIRIILPTPPGIGPDIFLRKLAAPLAQQLGQPVVIENRPGANGVIGGQAVAGAAPDGYTLLFTAVAELLAVKYVVRRPPYQPATFTPITAALGPLLFYVARPSLPAASMRELLAYAATVPDKLTYGTSGVGSPFHLVGEAVNKHAGVKIRHVPYKGTLAAIQDVLGGQIDIGFGSLAGISQYLKSGQLKALAAVATERTPLMPDVPAITELLPKMQLPPFWFAFWGPPGLSQPIVQRLQSAVVQAIDNDEMREWLRSNGFYKITSTPAELASWRDAGIAAYAELVKGIDFVPE
jgi:tripartite-type tricarboxylate transporter receptor subunit TctC